ncbi:MAG: Eco57I restriction-modification methylase domain-containing protein [Thermomicrobiales bacterium]
MITTHRQAVLLGLVDSPTTHTQRPVTFSDWLGSTYAASRIEAHRIDHGLFLTPPAVADFMAKMIEPRAATMRLLDPAAGAGILMCAVLEHLVALPNRPTRIEFVAYEIDAELCTMLHRVLAHATTGAADHGVEVTATVHQQDFILANAQVLGGASREQFDAVIANPPYFKIGKNDPRAPQARAVVHGQPNIYGLFMAVSAALVKPGGDCVFITPRSFASGPYFKRFRQRFFHMARPVRTHVFGSRKEAFSRDDVLQENVILHAVRDDRWRTKPDRHGMTISTSAGITDLASRWERRADLADVLDPQDPDSVFRLPISPEDEAVLHLVDGWTGSPRAYGLEISTGPVVTFRVKKWLAGTQVDAAVPLLWMSHVRAMEIHWPNGTSKPQYILSEEGSRRLLVPNRNYVVLRRFSAKEERRRLTAAPLLAATIPAPLIGLENHLNYIHRPGGSLTIDEAWGLAALFSSALFDRYFRCVSGNTQVGATELRAMPLPPIEDIIALGQRVQRQRAALATIDELVMEMTTGNPRLSVTREGDSVV